MAGSADVSGKQNYILGIGHPRNEAVAPGSPALESGGGGGGGGTFTMVRPNITLENQNVGWDYDFATGGPYTCRFYGNVIEVNSGNLVALNTYSTIPFNYAKDFANATMNLNGVEGWDATIPMPQFGTINFPDLKAVYNAANTSFTVHVASGNRVLNTPKLQYVQTLSTSYPATTTKWTAPLLKEVGLLSLSYPLQFASGSDVPIEAAGGLTINGSAWTTFSLPNVKVIRGNMLGNSPTNLTSISMPDVEYIGGVNLNSMTALLTSVSMPKLVETGGWFVSSSATTYLPIPPSIKKMGSSGVWYSGTATAAQVDAMLAFLVSLDGTNGTTLFGAASFPAGTTITARFDGNTTAPTAAGLASKAILQGRGVTVTTK